MTDDHCSDETCLKPVDRHVDPNVGNEKALDPDLLVTLSIAALSADRRAMSASVSKALAKGISTETIADHYVPTLARQMGETWCKDEMSFAGVTIGVSRLQHLLRDLGSNWSDDQTCSADAPTVLLIVCKEIYHTLGAVVLAGQLRRRGMSVCLELDATPEIITARLKSNRFDAVFISVSADDQLEELRDIVSHIRKCVEQAPPVVVGGAILEQDAEACGEAGADFVSCDVDAAIELCGLLTSPKKPG